MPIGRVRSVDCDADGTVNEGSSGLAVVLARLARRRCDRHLLLEHHSFDPHKSGVSANVEGAIASKPRRIRARIPSLVAARAVAREGRNSLDVSHAPNIAGCDTRRSKNEAITAPSP